MKPLRTLHRIWLLLAVAATWAASAQAQRAFNLAVAPLNTNTVAIGWIAQTATPFGDLQLVPQFQVERSTDLINWTPVGGLFSATAGQFLTYTDTFAGAGFYRVSSIINQQYAQLDDEALDGGQLQYADFFGAELYRATFEEATLTNANFGATDLRFADFTGAELDGASFFGVNAFQATFDESSMIGADCGFGDFEGTSFEGVDLTDSDFSSAILTGATLDYVTYNGMILDANTVMDPKPMLIWQVVNEGAVDAVLTNEDFSAATLSGSTFNGANLSNCSFFESFMDGTDLRGANLTNCDLEFTDLQGAQMNATTIIVPEARLVWQILSENYGAGRNLQNTNLSDAYLVGANFNGASLSNAVCTESILADANFGNANLVKASCIECNFNSAVFTNANLTNAIFTDADFTDANLRNANTNHAIFTGATFSGTIMPNGSIRNF